MNIWDNDALMSFILVTLIWKLFKLPINKPKHQAESKHKHSYIILVMSYHESRTVFFYLPPESQPDKRKIQEIRNFLFFQPSHIR